MPFALALASSVLYGTADFLGGFASRRAGVFAVTALSQGLGLLVLVAGIAFVPGVPRGADLAWGLAAGLCGSVGVMLLYATLAAGTLSTSAPLISMIAIAVPVSAGFLSGERPGPAPLLGIAAGVVAVALISAGEAPAGDGAPAGRRTMRALLPMAVASGLFIGGFLVCIGRIAEGSGLLPLVVARGTGTLVAALAMAGRREALRPALAAWRAVLGCGASDVVANLFYLLAAQRGPLGIMATIISLAPASTVVLAQLVLHERLARTQKAGVAVALVAIALLAQGAGR